MKRKRELKKERLFRERKYTEKLSEIAKEFKLSDAVLKTDSEIDDRHLIDNMSIRRSYITVDYLSENPKIEKDFDD